MRKREERENVFFLCVPFSPSSLSLSHSRDSIQLTFSRCRECSNLYNEYAKEK
jgi:hypothetical protein